MRTGPGTAPPQAPEGTRSGNRTVTDCIKGDFYWSWNFPPIPGNPEMEFTTNAMHTGVSHSA
ncbi:MAG: hypothetical protein WBB24_03535 [Maribacter sp.]